MITKPTRNRKDIIRLYNTNNMLFEPSRESYHVIVADYIYENEDFSWLDKYWSYLAKGGIFIAMADFKTNYLFRYHAEKILGAYLVNHAVWKNEWGNYQKDRMHQCYDDIMIYSNVKKGWKFYPDRIQVPKATANTKLNPSGRSTKPSTAWIDNITLTTTSKERVKDPSTGKLIRWQKPLALFDRVLLPFSDEGDNVLDLFMGSGTVPLWCYRNGRTCDALELDKNVFEVASQRLFENGVFF